MKLTLTVLFSFVTLMISGQTNPDHDLWFSLGNKTFSIVSILDLNHSKIQFLDPSVTKKISIDLEKSILFNEEASVNFELIVHERDSLQIRFGNNNSINLTFRPLNKKANLKNNITEIKDFLTSSPFSVLNDILSLEFSSENFPYTSKEYGIRVPEDAMILKTTENENIGFWYLREIGGQVFLIFKTANISDLYVFHLQSFNHCKLKIKEISKKWFLGQVTELKTCS